MLRGAKSALATVTMIALGGVLATATPGTIGQAAAQTTASPVTDMSSQKKNEAKPARAAPARAAPQRAAPRMAPQRAAPQRAAPRAARPAARTAPRNTTRVAPAARTPRVATPHAPRTTPSVTKRAVTTRTVTKRTTTPRVIPARHGPQISSRIRSGGPIRVGGRNVTIIRSRRFVNWHGQRRYLLPFAGLAALTIGAIAYSPYGYLPVAQNYCDGFTEDGCQLQWTDVPTEDGDVVPQCVTYCPAQ